MNTVFKSTTIINVEKKCYKINYEGNWTNFNFSHTLVLQDGFSTLCTEIIIQNRFKRNGKAFRNGNLEEI